MTLHRKLEEVDFDNPKDAMAQLQTWLDETDRDLDPEFGIDPPGSQIDFRVEDGWTVWRRVDK